MTTDWTLLEPWYAVVLATIDRNLPTDSEMEVSFKWPSQATHQRELTLVLHLETTIQHNVLKLIQIRDAIELFSVYSTVDNKAFTERFQHIAHRSRQETSRWYPSWTLYVRGSATVQQATWSSLFDFSDTSPQFQRAIDKLKMKGVENKSMKYLSDFYNLHIGWACKFGGADVDMRTVLHFGGNFIFKTGLQRLLKAGVPLVKQLGLTEDAATLVDVWRTADETQGPMDISLSLTIHDFTTTYSRVLAALPRLPKRSLEVVFNKEKGTVTMRSDIQLNQVCPLHCPDFKVKCDKLSIGILAAISSLQAMQSESDSDISIFVDSVDSESWPLLIDVVCCEPTVGISLMVKNAILTNSDLLNVAAWRGQSRIASASSRDSEPQVSSEFRFLQLDFLEIESVSLVINLLRLIGKNLRSLKLFVTRSVDRTFDLSELSAVCPNLEALQTCYVQVVVRAHTEALGLWPIQDLSLDCFSKLSDIALCLRNPDLRMTHELTDIRVREFRGEEMNEEKKRELLLHDGEFLSIRKEKVPIRSKTAMLSVVNGSCLTQAIHRLDNDVLGLIFGFASIPATRSVRFWSY